MMFFRAAGAGSVNFADKGSTAMEFDSDDGVSPGGVASSSRLNRAHEHRDASAAAHRSMQDNFLSTDITPFRH